ncbi:MAG TPA: GvpL/GvpF family gas vesicle protein [Myxococcales bacterium]|nr:GvpL/GvpF family gas vesicle protein [Myxococcales bacterium]
MNSATYLYCVVQSPGEPSLRGVPPGLPGAGKPRAVDAGRGVWLVVADAPLERYGEKPIEKGLRDLSWVTPVAVAHEAVVEHLARTGTVLPMKLLTLFRSDARALDHVARQRTRIERLLKRLEGREEWGLRVLLDEASALRRARDEARSAAAGAPGAAFLLRKKKEHDAARELIEHARDRADELFELLSAKADDARRRPPPPGEIGKRVLLDAAFLLPRRKLKSFQSAVRASAKKLAARDYQLTLTGPWPAYTFVGDAEAK